MKSEFASLVSATLAALIGSTAFAVQAARSVTLAWDPNPEPDISGYVVYYGNASGAYSYSTNVGNQVTATIGGLAEGQTYFFVLTARNNAGLESLPSNEVSYQVPTAPAPPTIGLSSPPAGATYTAPASIGLGASVTANGNPITTVQFYDGATLLGEDTTAPYAFAWNNVSAGNYSLSARALYGSGSSASSSAVGVTVSNPPPTIGLSSPPAGATYTAPASIGLGASVTANGNPITTVQFYNGATLLGEDTTAPYAFAWNNVSAGNYSLSARALYGSGSSASSSAVGVTVSNPPPTIGLSSPPAGATYTAPASIGLGASVTANGNPITTVQFYNGATLLGEDTTAPYAFAWNNVSAGNYSLSARALYGSGSSASSSAVGVTVSNPPPTIGLSSPLAGATYTAPASIGLGASVTVNGNPITTVQFYNGATLLGEDTTAPYAFAWNNVSAGNYSLSARALYGSGSSASSSAVGVTVSNPSLPVVLTSPSAGTTYTAPATIGLAAVVSPSSNTVTKVRFYNGAVMVGEDTTAPYAFSWNNVSAGNYSLSARALYGSGSSASSSVVGVTVSNRPPPTVVLISPSAGTTYTAPATIALAASVAPNSNTVTKVRFYNGAVMVGEDTTAPYAFSWNHVSAGNYSLTARALYGLGSSASSSAVSVTVSNPPPPTVVLTSPSEGSSYTAPASIALAASVTANGNSIRKVRFYNGPTMVGEDTSAPYAFAWNHVSAGNYALRARVVYDGDRTVDSASVSVTVTILSPPWQTADIGDVGISGSGSSLNGTFSLRGTGALSGLADSFRFVYQSLSSDGEIRACLKSLDGGGSSALSGVMIRESLTANSTYAFMGFQQSGAILWQRRSSTAGSTSSTTDGTAGLPGVWLRLVRTGNLLSGYKSSDGASWTLVNSHAITMAPNVYFGFAVASGTSNTLSASTFSNVTAVP